VQTHAKVSTLRGSIVGWALRYLVVLTPALLVACGNQSGAEPGERDDPIRDASVSTVDTPQAAVDASIERPAPAPARDARVDSTDAGDVERTPDAALATSDLPCELRDVLAAHCWSCHGSAQKFGAPMSLVRWEDLQRPSASQPEVTTFQHALARSQDDVRPMPPAPHARLTSAELAVLQTWTQADTQKASTACTTPVSVPELPVVTPAPADCEATYELRAHGEQTPDDDTKYTIAPHLDDSKYQCFYFDVPFADDSSLFWYEPILDNVKSIHHWILYATSNKQHASGSSGLCNSAEPGSNFVAGWGPGTNNVLLPDDVGLMLQSGPKAGLVLEVHYNNDSELAQQDASGVRFCVGARSKRAHLAAVHSTGSEGICIEPGSKREVFGTCSPRTDLGDIHITGLWPHMHKRARRMTVTITRKAGGTELVHDAPFDFNAQYYHVKNDVVVHSGDTLETRCFYENDSPDRARFGEGTNDEMCYGFITAWPAGALVSASDGLSALRSDLANRCADPLSVLASCNGIADAL